MKFDPKGGASAALKKFEAAVEKSSHAKFVLRLYVSGATPHSQHAVTNIKKLCEKALKGRYYLEVIDVYQAPLRAKEDQIIAAPTLVKVSPSPRRQLLGDLSDENRVLIGLGLK